MFGHDIDRELEAAKSCIGVVPQELNFNQFESPLTIVVNQAGFYGIPRAGRARARREIPEAAAAVGQAQWRWRAALSGGMKRRLMIARALMHEPRLLILDEPTAGVDIEIRRSMWEFLRDINERGTTIILTTHYLEEAENLCRNIAIIDGGRIVERDRMSNLLRAPAHRDLRAQPARAARGRAPARRAIRRTLVDDHTLEVEVSKEQNLNDIFVRLSQLGIDVVSMRNKVNRLEEIFMRLVETQGARGMSRAGRDAPRAEPTAVAVTAHRWIGFRTIVIREYGRIMRIWGQTLVPPAVTATLYFMIFGSLIGRRVGQMGGFDYMQYIAPGLIMMAVITNSYGNVVVLVLRRQVRQAHRGAAGLAAAELADRRRLRGRRPAARPAGGHAW